MFGPYKKMTALEFVPQTLSGVLSGGSLLSCRQYITASWCVTSQNDGKLFAQIQFTQAGPCGVKLRYASWKDIIF